MPYKIVVEEPEFPEVMIFTVKEVSEICGDAVVSIGNFNVGD